MSFSASLLHPRFFQRRGAFGGQSASSLALVAEPRPEPDRVLLPALVADGLDSSPDRCRMPWRRRPAAARRGTAGRLRRGPPPPRRPPPAWWVRMGRAAAPDVPAWASSPGVRPVHQPAAGWGQARCARRRPGPGPRMEAGPGARRRARAPHRAARGNVAGRVANCRLAPPPHSEVHAADSERGLRGHSTPVAPLSGPQLRRVTVGQHQTALPASSLICQLRCVVASFVSSIMGAESPGSVHRPVLLRLRDSWSG
jgi:hypothetical protein